ncbi:hypothetical protein CEXT_81301 [Caerostris extrusa]|uniref:Uncharacterized protein n=1 Tax=Caerostris extrusa TaxID=172846 RepID=A0AAV4VNB7_CAEEX|nr:hypothetical protein CEXT_81301 [Caerostris extrusa]
MHSNPIAHVLIDRSVQCTMRSLRMSVARLRIWWGCLLTKSKHRPPAPRHRMRHFLSISPNQHPQQVVPSPRPIKI